MKLVKKEVIILVLFLVLPLAYAQDTELNNYDNIKIDLVINSSIEIEHLKGDWALDFISANLSLFPISSEWQTISNKELTSNPKAQIEEEDNSIYYKWTNPKELRLDFGYESTVKTKTNFKKIRDKIKFPITTEGLEEFISPTETITSEYPLIVEKASELAEGEDDLYKVVHKIALWTKENVDYSLETLTAEVSQPASWVIENKKGVCDELTSLFIAMLRSLNIPSRVVVGSSYTNLLNEFGNHAWAEVYFPGYGWVAFDPTYGQLGYTDATHIKMKDSPDVKQSSVEYYWRSRGVDVKSTGINVDINVVENGSLSKADVDIDVEVLRNKVKSGSYVPIKVDIENLEDYYLPLILTITKAPTEFEDNIKHVLLKPNEEKSVFFILPIPEDIKGGYVYTSIIEVVDNFNNLDSEEVIYSKEDPLYTLEEAQNKVDQLRKEEEKVYSSDVDLNCSLDKDFYYDYETAIVNCEIKNKGNTNLKDIVLCIENNCNNFDLRITESSSVEFELELEPGSKETIVIAENKDVTKSSFLDLNVLPEPNLSIQNLDYSQNVNYKDTYKLTFNLDTKSKIKNVVVKINNKEIFELESFDDKDQFVVPFEGNFFYNEDETNINIEYEDLKENSYTLKEPLSINVINIPFYVKLGWYWLILVVLIAFILYKKYYKK